MRPTRRRGCYTFLETLLPASIVIYLFYVRFYFDRLREGQALVHALSRGAHGSGEPIQVPGPNHPGSVANLAFSIFHANKNVSSDGRAGTCPANATWIRPSRQWCVNCWQADRSFLNGITSSLSPSQSRSDKVQEHRRRHITKLDLHIPLVATNVDFDPLGLLPRLMDSLTDYTIAHKLIAAGGCQQHFM